MPRGAPIEGESAKRLPISLAQLASYDDFLTDALVDHAFYWTLIPKNRFSYHPSRALRESDITTIIQTDLIVNRDPATAAHKLLATAGFAKYHAALQTPQEQEDFCHHMRRYLRIYLPDAPFEVNSTNRYTIVTQEASITARQFIKKGETVKYLCGIQVNITPEEEKEISFKKKDFSIVLSSRSRCASLFMGPARFANHDCGANAKLVTSGHSGIEVIATADIDVGDEITVSYGLNYFGESNCECLCATCESRFVCGWSASPEATSAVKETIKLELNNRSYSLRRRRRDPSAPHMSRTPSVTPSLRPRVRKVPASGRKLAASSATSPLKYCQNVLPQKPYKRTTRPTTAMKPQQGADHQVATLATPPMTPARCRKPLIKDRAISASIASSPLLPSVRGRAIFESSIDGDSPHDHALLSNVTSPNVGSTPSSSACDVAGAVKLEEDEDDKKNDSKDDNKGENKINGPLRRLSTRRRRTAFPSTRLGSNASLAIHPPSPVPTRTSNGGTPAPYSTSTQRPLPSIEAAATSQHEGLQSPLKRQRRVFVKQPTPPTRRRVPGDYTLTPMLLAQPDMAWIHCTNCAVAFVQQDAYYTRSSCPRCERHSKLYGYIWPKTQPAGLADREERVLDHRTVHRFLDFHDEARIRGRKRIRSASSPDVDAPSLLGKRPCVSLALPEPDDEHDDSKQTVSSPPCLRRSGRTRCGNVRLIPLS